jgi:hypothetical protein
VAKNVQRWVGEQTFTMNSEVVRQPSVVNDDLAQSERRRFKISELFCEFPQISRTGLCIITVKIGSHHKFCTRRVPKMLTGAHKTQTMASALTPLERYHKDGDEFLNHIERVTDDETWVSFVNVETKEQ